MSTYIQTPRNGDHIRLISKSRLRGILTVHFADFDLEIANIESGQTVWTLFDSFTLDRKESDL